MTHQARVVPVHSLDHARTLIKDIGSDPQSIEIMAPKAVFMVIQLDHVSLQDAIIVKQDMLSIGGEVAIPKHSFDLETDPGSILLMGTLAHYQELIGKLARHYPRIQRLAKEIETVIQKTH